MNLDTTLKVLRIVLGEAKTTSDCDIVASYADSTASSFSLGNQNEKSNGVTPVVVASAPGVDTQRQVKEIRLFNNDTVIHTVTLQLYDGTNIWVIGPSALSVSPGAAFVYTPESGVCCPSGAGTVTQIVAGTNLNVGAGPGGTIVNAGTLNLVNVPVVGGIVGNAATLTVNGLAAGSGGLVSVTGGTSSTAAAAGGAVNINGGVPGAGGVGGAVLATAGAGDTNAAGGLMTLTAGAGAGTGAGAVASLFGGASGTGATGNGGRARIQGGAALSTNGTGGTGQQNGGAGSGTGAGGSVALNGGAGGATSGTGGAANMQAGAGGGIGSGGGALVTGGVSGSGATGNGGDATLRGGTPVSTTGDGGHVFVTAGNASGGGNAGSVSISAGSVGGGTPGNISMFSQVQLLSGVPTVPAVNSNTISGSDQAGLITIGAGATTSVVVTFGGNYQFPPASLVLSPANAAAAAAGVGAYANALLNTGWTLNGTALANCAFYYHAF